MKRQIEKSAAQIQKFATIAKVNELLQNVEEDFHFYRDKSSEKI